MTPFVITLCEQPRRVIRCDMILLCMGKIVPFLSLRFNNISIRRDADLRDDFSTFWNNFVFLWIKSYTRKNTRNWNLCYAQRIFDDCHFSKNASNGKRLYIIFSHKADQQSDSQLTIYLRQSAISFACL